MARCAAADILGYVPPELHEGKTWFIDFYARHPAGDLRRKRIKVNRVKGLTARRAYARRLIDEITRRLQGGWTPWVANEPAQAFVTLGDALDQWDRTKTRQLRNSSPHSYTSMSSVLREWCRGQGLLDRTVASFTAREAGAYMHYVGDVRLVGNRTYNNHITNGRMLWSWFMERQLATADPFAGIRKRKAPRKSRTYLTDSERREMVAWICEHDPHFLLPVLLVYGCLIRPAELKRLRVGDVDMQLQVIKLAPELTKSGTERTPAIPDWMLPYLHAAGLQQLPGKTWLVGANVAPGEKPVARNSLHRRWCRLRAALRWPSSKQFYSLRDTGIIQLLRDRVDLLHVMQQAGHEDVGTTNKYLRHAFPEGPPEVRQKATPITAGTGLMVELNPRSIVEK